MSIPLSPEEQARVDAYWGTTPANASIDPPPAPAPPPAAPPNPFTDGVTGGASTIATPQPPTTSLTAPSPPAPFASATGTAPIAPPQATKLPPKPMDPAFRISAQLSEPPPVATGPTMQDNADFSRFQADQMPKKTAAPARTGAPGAKPNPDPYGINAAQQKELGAYDSRADAAQRVGDAEAVKLANINDAQQHLSRIQEEDAAIARAENDYAQKHYDEGMQEIGRQLDDVRAKKIDPLRVIKEQPALAALSVLGGALSGFYQGFTGGQDNQFLKDLNRQFDRAQAEDERQINDEKWTIGQTGNLLQQQRDLQKDHDLAALQNRNLMYEAAKQEMLARAADADIPAVKARAQDAVAQIEQAQGALAEAIGTKKQAMSAAAANAAFAKQKEVQQTYATTYEKVLGAGYTPAQAEAEARRAVQVMYLGNAGPRPQEPAGNAALPKSARDEMAKETAQAQREAMAGLAAIKSFDPKKVSAANTIEAHLPNMMQSSNVKAENDERERYNALVRPLIGAAWRLQTHSPEPRNGDLLDEQAETFKALPSDGPPDVARRQKNLEQHLINAARAGGVDLPDSRQDANVARELGAKPVK